MLVAMPPDFSIAQGEPDVGVVQVVGRADADVVDGRAFAAEFVDVAVEALGFGEEIRGWEIAVDHADAVVGVERGDQLVAGVFDGAHVARCNKAGGADEGEGLGVHLSCRCGRWNARWGFFRSGIWMSESCPFFLAVGKL